MANDRANQDAIDHAAHLSVLDSLNRQDFIRSTTGQKIETSNQFTHNWISSDKNSVVLGADPTFDPNGAVDPIRESWTELIPADDGHRTVGCGSSGWDLGIQSEKMEAQRLRHEARRSS